MKTKAWVAALVFLIIAPAQAAPARAARAPPKPATATAPVRPLVLDGIEHSYATLLLGRDANVKRTAKLLATQAGLSRDMLDVMATLLWQGCTGRRDVNDAAQVSLVAALDLAADPRYWNVLLDCYAQAEHPKVRAKADAALDRLPDDRVPQLKASAIRLEDVRKSLEDAVARDATRRAGKTLQDIARGTPAGAVYAKIGLPDEVQLVSIQYSGILASWDKLGAITFRSGRAAERSWEVASIAVAGAKGDARQAQVRQWLATRDARALARIGKELIESGESDRAVLDEVARRIDRTFDTGDTHEAGGLSWLCKALGASGDGRYREFLLDIASLASSRRLREYAQSAAGRLPDGDPDPY